MYIGNVPPALCLLLPGIDSRRPSDPHWNKWLEDGWRDIFAFKTITPVCPTFSCEAFLEIPMNKNDFLGYGGLVYQISTFMSTFAHFLLALMGLAVLLCPRLINQVFLPAALL